MFTENPRNWKWMVPSTLAGVFLIVWSNTQSWGTWAGVWLVLAIVCGLAGILNFWLYWDDHVSTSRQILFQLQNTTPEVRIAEAMSRMHPDAVAAYVAHKRSVWRLKYIPVKDFADWIYDDAPLLHAGFMEFVLDHSNGRRGELMPKSRLSQGSKQFDPMGITTDYEQYDVMVALMERKMMITKAMGNQPPKFLPPYTIETIRRHFALYDDDGSVESDEKTVTMQRAAREMADAAIGIPAPRAMQEMPAEKKPAPPYHPVGTSDDVPELTDEEVRRINEENERYQTLFTAKNIASK